MSSTELVGVDGSNPLGFLAALGLLRVIPGVKLGFRDDGSFHAFVEGVDGKEELARRVADDASVAASKCAPWRLEYTKAATKKQGPQVVADLKAPPKNFKNFLATCIDAWLKGSDEGAAYAAAYATDVAVDGKGNTKPTAFHFTAANQTFLGTVESIRASVTEEWFKKSLFEGYGEEPGQNLRWNPNAERNWALMASGPSRQNTLVNAPLEWLAFRGLPLLPSFPRGSKIVTTAVTGGGEEMAFTWPLWSVLASLQTVRSLVQLDWAHTARAHAARGVFAICRCPIRRTSQGYGNFGPSLVASV